MQLDVERLRAQEPEAVRSLSDLCEKCARTGAYKVGAEDFAEDIAQDMAIVVLQSFLHRYDGVSDVDSFLIEMARRMGLAYRRKHSKEVIASPSADDDWDPISRAADPDHVPAEDQIADEITQEEAQAARDALITRIRARSAPGATALSEARPTSGDAVRSDAGEDGWYRINLRRAPVVQPNPDNPLVLCRKDTGLSLTALASSLGISVVELRDAERQKSVPRKLRARLDAVWQALGRGLSEMDGPTCVERWCEQLGIDLDRTTELAEQIGVHRATVYRWRTGKSHPPVYLIRKLDVLVSVLAERRQKMLSEALGVMRG